MTLRYKISALLFFFALTLMAQENIFPYREGNLWGLCDENATVLVAPKYDAIKKDKSKGITFFEVSSGNNSGVYIGSKNVIPVDFQKLYYLPNNLLIAVKKDTNKKETQYLYYTNGELLINNPLSFLKAIKGNDHYENSFIIGFYLRDLEGKESLVNLDYYNKNKLSYIIKDFFSIELDNKKSKEELAIAYVKQTATSAVETKYFRVEGSQIILLDEKKDSQYILDNSGKKKNRYDDYDTSIAVPNIDSEMVVEEPRAFSGTGSGSGDGPGRGNTTRKTPKGTSYYKYALIENQIEVEVSNNVTKSKKTVKFPIKADKIEIFKSKGLIVDEKSFSDSTQSYFNYIIYQKKNKYGLVYQFPFQKSVEYDFLEPMNSEKKFNYSLKNYFKVGIIDKKTKTMKYGVIDTKHNVVLPFEYEEIKVGYTIIPMVKEQVFLVKKNNLYGLISEKLLGTTADAKEIKLPIEFDSIEFNSENQSFLRVKKGNQHSAYISYYSNSDYVVTLLPSYYPYPVKEIRYTMSSGKKEISLLEAIEYITLEDEKGNFKGYANPNGILYFKD
ncbi:WG repeat protein [Flavobacterium aquaticum]|uniref:WG repeat protein n=1 Tax=Flavobacterium aquaticum TaxID=1236486 RepID=A0A327YX57_9FLAO|nr:WG repeat-containing protein [Flavobacterium aquaticum]RAK24487.1 WG repeat protein [Flavobacterium aquaticum]